MKIILLTQVLPYPPDSGPKIKTWNVIKYLSKDHQITLISFTRGNQKDDEDHLRRYCYEVHTIPLKRGVLSEIKGLIKSILTGIPWIIARDYREEMHALIKRVSGLQSFDYVHVDQLNMAQYADAAKGAKTILDAHNALWLLYKRLSGKLPLGIERILYERDWRLLRGYERDICRKSDAVIAVSEEDRNALEEVAGPLTNISVVPIAMDTDEIAPIQRNSNANHLISIGTMFWQPNVDGILWFAKDIYPLIKRHFPRIEFDVIGSRPPASVKALSQLDSSIHILGYVPDPTDYIKRAGVMVVPLRAGGGMRVKILNAMAQSIPVVTTTLGCEGISAENGTHLLIADTPEEFSLAVEKLLNDPEAAERLGKKGRCLIEENYDYRKACRPLDQIYPK